MTLPVPPADLRAGMGPFEDANLFLVSGLETLELARRLIDVSVADDVLDLGCGCGRLAIHLLSYLNEAGSYLGIDVDADCISWCQKHISSLRADFVFRRVDVRSSSYNPEGAVAAEHITLPADRASVDCAVLSSLFTHMEEPGVRRYLAELGRVLRPGGRVLISTLLMNDEARSAIADGKTLFDFRHQLGEESWTLDPSRPLEAVALSERWFRDTAVEHQLAIGVTEYGTWRSQRSWKVGHDWVVLRQRAEEAV